MVVQIIRLTDLVRWFSDGVCRDFVHAFRALRNFAIRLHESIQRDPRGTRARGTMPRRIRVRFLDTA